MIDKKIPLAANTETYRNPVDEQYFKNLDLRMINTLTLVC